MNKFKGVQTSLVKYFSLTCFRSVHSWAPDISTLFSPFSKNPRYSDMYELTSPTLQSRI